MPVEGRRTLILVENLSVPQDRRVWLETLALRRAGYRVVVVCPKGRDRDTESFAEVDGIEIHRFQLTPSGGGPLGYAREYAQALWRMARLVRRLTRGEPFDVVHACNPPDLLLLTALHLRRRGTRFIFDQHDLVPELYLSRFGRGRDVLYRATLVLESLSYRLAHVVIATNESYRRIALARGRKLPEDVFVVRNGPDLTRFRPQKPDESLRRGRRHLIAYVGMMGPQDGVDHALRALAILHEARDDWFAIFAGDGDARPTMRRLAEELGISEDVEFTGLLGDAEVVRVLASADVCISPEPSNPLNDVSTMIKVGEYMAMGKPVVAYDLAETRFTANGAASYATPNEVRELASRIAELLDDAARRSAIGDAGRRRAEDVLAWEHSVKELLAAYARALS